MPCEIRDSLQARRAWMRTSLLRRRASSSPGDLYGSWNSALMFALLDGIVKPQ